MPPTVIPWFIAIVLPGWSRPPETLTRMAMWCMRFTPRVHLEHVGCTGVVPSTPSTPSASTALLSSSPPSMPTSMPPLILLDVSGCLRVNGGARRVVGRIARGLTRRGIVHALGSAPSSGQAVVQAMGVGLGYGNSYAPHPSRHHHPSLDIASLEQLPFQCLRISDAICAALREVNLTRIGEARVIARSALTDRYGPELGERLDMAFGLRPWPFRSVTPAVPVVGEFVFASPCAQQEAVELACIQAIEMLCAAIESSGDVVRNEDGSVRASRIGCTNGRGVRTLAVRVERARLATVIGTIHFGEATRDPRHLWSILRPRIQRMHLGEHELGEGIERILLTATRVGRCRGGTPFLGGAVGMAATNTSGSSVSVMAGEGDHRISIHSGNDHHAATQRAIGELVDQLHARLGQGGVRRADA